MRRQRIWKGILANKLPMEIQQFARRKLRMINNARDLNDLKIPPANRLEKLKANLENYCNIRINDRWRIIFVWANNDAFDVKIVDYH
ncbi:MAG: type II toxin-antitoxin system RelE/ParE family toxin [Saprospiraceae bacterium]